MVRNGAIDALRILNEAEDDSQSDQAKHGIADIEQTYRADLLFGLGFADDALLEPKCKVDKEEDEQLLEANLRMISCVSLDEKG
jgi:hypothetical protein